MSQKLNDLVQGTQLAPEDNPVLQGNFAPVDEENTLASLEVVGTIPAEIKGTLLRDGPNPVDPQPGHHWFSGDGMLHAIKMEGGKAASYRNRWIRTEALQEKTGLPAAPASPNKLDMQGSGSVNIVSHGGRLLALSEIGLPIEVGLEVQTKRQYDFGGELKSNMTAHPKIDGKTGEMIFFGYELAPPYLRYHRANCDGELVQSVEIDLPNSVMMHDFGVTSTRVVLMDLPIVFDLDLAMQEAGMPFIWDESHQARLGVMDRNATTDDVKWIDIDPCFVFHPLNCYDEADKIVMDVVRYERAFTPLADSNYKKGSQLVRWIIDADAGTVETHVLSDKDQEFPRVNPMYECHPHRYGYVVEAGTKHGFGGLYKHDLQSGTTQYHDVGAECAAGEPVFVPTGTAEDEGYVLSVVYDDTTQLSEVRIIDARRFTEAPVAVVKLGVRVPFGFHGNFVAA